MNDSEGFIFDTPEGKAIILPSIHDLEKEKKPDQQQLNEQS
jgi:hypothetical protein